MSAGYKGFETRKRSNFKELPPVGAYVAEIRDVRELPPDGKQNHKVYEMMIEITDGEYKERYHEIYNDQKERFGSAKYKGIFRLVEPLDNDEDWRKRSFESNLWCVEQSNPGYTWDWNCKSLKGKKIGISVRKRLYTFNGKDGETTEIARFETTLDVKAGKCRPVKDRDTRSTAENEPNFTEVSDVDVPW